MTSGALKLFIFLTVVVTLCVTVHLYTIRFSPVSVLRGTRHIQPKRISLPLSECDCQKCNNTSDRQALLEMIRGPLDQTDDRLVNLIRTDYLIAPAPRTVPYKLAKPSTDPSMGQSAVVKKIFEGQSNGFFIECGALDGETRSNTLSLEKDFGWEGLLIEGDPSNFELVRTKNRKAWLADCCLAINPYPHVTNFVQDFNVGQIVDPNGLRSKSARTRKVTKRQCLPLYSILKAINVSTVDYFSLDVEGFELEVLRTIPFDQVLSVEFSHGKGGSEPLRAFMESQGYSVLTQVKNPYGLANDFIFIHNSLQNNLTLPTVINN